MGAPLRLMAVARHSAALGQAKFDLDQGVASRSGRSLRAGTVIGL